MFACRAEYSQHSIAVLKWTRYLDDQVFMALRSFRATSALVALLTIPIVGLSLVAGSATAAVPVPIPVPTPVPVPTPAPPPANLQGAQGSPSATSFWLTSPTGMIWNMGGANSYGQINSPLSQPIVGIAPTPDAKGYWLVASDGGVFTFGDAKFYGSTGAITLSKPVVGIAPTPDAKGYWLVASDGGVFTFGDAKFY